MDRWITLAIPILMLQPLLLVKIHLQYIRITPTKKWSWGIDEPVFVEGKFNVKKAKKDGLEK